VPRAFTVDESDRIRVRLKEAGLAAFARRGVRGTTVEALAREAAISKGAFYRFYDSKEHLLLELLDEIELSMQAEIVAAVRADPAHGIALLVDSAVHAVERNPLLPVLMSPEALHVFRAQPPAAQEERLGRDVRLVADVLAILREAGVEPGVPADVLLGLLRSLVFVGLHREDVGPPYVDAVAGWLKAGVRAALLLPREEAVS
jgi:AcrR family transcriptional regulator